MVCLLERKCLGPSSCNDVWLWMSHHANKNELWNMYCKRVFTMNKNDVFLDKVPMRNTSNCLYVCRTLDYVAKHRTGFSPPSLDEPPSWHSITSRHGLCLCPTAALLLGSVQFRRSGSTGRLTVWFGSCV